MLKRETYEAQLAQIEEQIELKRKEMEAVIEGGEALGTLLRPIKSRLKTLERMASNRRKWIAQSDERRKRVAERAKNAGEAKPFERKKRTKEYVDTPTAQYMRDYYVAHKAEINARQKEWRKDNQEYMKAYRKKWYEENKDEHKKNVVDYIKRRTKSDPKFRRQMKIRSALAAALRNDKIDDATSHMVHILGYTPSQFKDRFGKDREDLIAQGKKPSIDHMIPLKYFNDGTPDQITHALDNLRVVELNINRNKHHNYATPVRHEYYCMAIFFIKEEFKEQVRYVGQPF